MASFKASDDLSRNNGNTIEQKCPVKPRRRNSEKRKEKSRNAARCRRGQESEIYFELAQQLPLSTNICQHLDKAGIMRLCISYLKTRQLIPHKTVEEKCIKNKENDSLKLASLVDDLYLKSLEGFIYILSQDGDIVYLSENVSQFLGLTQVDLMGQSIYEFAHPCDHDEIRDQLAEKHGSTSESRDHQNFLLRLKCTLTDKGKTVNLKSAVYKVVQCIGHKEWESSIELKDSESPSFCLVVIASPIPHPSNIEHPLDSKTFVSRHNLDMTFTDCDERIETLLGYNVSEVESHSFYKFFHAADNVVVEKNLKDLYSKGQSVIGRYRFLAKDGGYAWVTTEATLIYHNKTYKPQCIVCIHYMISDIEREEEIVSLDQEVASSKAESKSMNSGESDSPFIYWSPSENQTIEVDPGELDSLAPTPGEVFVPLFSSSTKDGQMSSGTECSFNYDDMMQGIGNDFMDFNPFAPMENEIPPKEMELDQKSTDLNKDPILPSNYASSSEDEVLDELGMNAPVILDEGCQFMGNVLTDFDGLSWNSCRSVNPFSLDALTGSLEDAVPALTTDSHELSQNNSSTASLPKMSGLSRSMPNMSIGAKTTAGNSEVIGYDRSVTPNPNVQVISPDVFLNFQENLSDQRNVPPDIQQRLSQTVPNSPVGLQTSPVTLQNSPQQSLQSSPQTSYISPQTSPVSQRIPLDISQQSSPQTFQFLQKSLMSPKTSPISIGTSSPMSSKSSQISPHTTYIAPKLSPISSGVQISAQTSPFSSEMQISPQTLEVSPHTTLLAVQIPTEKMQSSQSQGLIISQMSQPMSQMSQSTSQISQPTLLMSQPTPQISQPTLLMSQPSQMSQPTLLMSQPTPQMSQPTPQMSQPTSQISQPTLLMSQPPPQMSQPTLMSQPMSQMSYTPSQIFSTFVAPNTPQIIPISSSVTTSSRFNIPSNSGPEKTPAPDWKQLNIGQQPKFLFNDGSNPRILKRKHSIDISPVKAKLFAFSINDRISAVKTELGTVDCPIQKTSGMSIGVNTSDMVQGTRYEDIFGCNVVSNTLTHSKLLQQVAMKANESTKRGFVCAPSLRSTSLIANLINSSKLPDSMPLITQYDAEVNAPVTSSKLLQGNDLLRALEQSKVET